MSEKLKLIEPSNQKISTTRQCELLGVNRSTFYYEKKPESEENIKLMRRIDEIYTKCPFYGYPKITEQLKREGCDYNHKRIARLMNIMGIQAIISKRNLSKKHPQNPVYPYLLKGANINFPNYVWGTDITYIRADNNWFYLIAMIDWFSRYVLSWKLSHTMADDSCIEILENALKINKPEIHNSDQGSQFTSIHYTDILKENEIKISMDGRGRCFDNIFTERLWRTVKYEEVYLKDYSSFSEAEKSLNNYFNFYNNDRIHQALNYKTPAEIYFNKI